MKEPTDTEQHLAYQLHHRASSAAWYRAVIRRACARLAATIRAQRHPAVERVVAEVATRRRPAIWATLVLVVAAEVAVFLFPPLLVLCSRWLVAPVVSTAEGTSTRGALGASHELIRGHGWRAVGMVVTLLVVLAAWL